MGVKDEDIGFTFDPKGFLNGLRQVTHGMGELDQTSSKTAKNMSGGFQKAVPVAQVTAKAIGKAFSGAILKLAGLGAVLKGAFATVKEYMPEIGKTFSIAKDIFFKNFLWPLRQALAPYLQKLLDWVRDNRAMFVKWGSTLANVFRVGIVLVKGLWTILKSVIDIFKPFIQSLFHGGLEDIVDLLMTKVAVLVAWISGGVGDLIAKVKGPIQEVLGFVGDIASKVWEFAKHLFTAKINGASLAESMGKLAKALWKLVGDSVKKAIENIKAFIKGLTGSELKNAGGVLSAVADALTSLVNVIDLIVGNSDMKGFSEWLGETFGNAAQLTLATFGAAAVAVAKILGNMMYSFQIMKTMMANKDTSVLKGQLDAFNAQIDKSQSRIAALGNAATKALGKDFGIFTLEDLPPSGPIPPADMRAAKDLLRGGSGGKAPPIATTFGKISTVNGQTTIDVKIGGATFNVVVPAGSDPKAYANIMAQEYGTTLGDVLASELRKQKTVRGAQ